MIAPTSSRALLTLAVGAFTPDGRRENPETMRLGLRIGKLDPVPVGFVMITESELTTYYMGQLRPPGHVAASLENINMTPDEAESLYRQHIRRRVA